MKFAHEFKQALVKEGFPELWVQSAIPYGQLKKCIKKLNMELRTLGLDPATLEQLIANPDQSLPTPRRGSGDGPVAFQYDFDGDFCPPRRPFYVNPFS